MNLKQIVKQVLPRSVIHAIKHTRLLLWKESLSQAGRFATYYSRPNSRDKVQIETQVTFHIHQIEKGLSHREFRFGFGQSVVKELSVLLQRLQIVDQQYLSNPVYREALIILNQYYRRHAEAEFDLSLIHAYFPQQLWDRIVHVQPAATTGITVEAISKRRNNSLPFFELVKVRHSVREYSSKALTSDDFTDVLEAAIQTPSVCNRQPTRVHIILDKTTIQAALQIQGGLNGYPTPPALVLITSDIRAFMSENERNQGYVDGGLFAMTFLYGLEAKGLAACPLHTMFSDAQNSSTRKLLAIPENEVLVMYIAVGHFLDSVPVCRSERYSANHISTITDTRSE
jgi:nitroreductase